MVFFPFRWLPLDRALSARAVLAENSRTAGVVSTRTDDLTGWNEYEVEKIRSCYRM
jgi:hypothetical protein